MSPTRRSFLKHASLATLGLWIPKTFAEATATKLARSTPEAEDVASKAILDFLDAVEREKFELHSFMMLRHGKVIAEGWWEPYGPELVHTMYSMSKSFTSTAVVLPRRSRKPTNLSGNRRGVVDCLRAQMRSKSERKMMR